MKPKQRKVKLGRSKISGRGVKATHVLQRGEIIDEEIVGEIGFNHSCEPNVLITRGQHSLCVAMRRIGRGEELTVDYRITSRHRSFSHGMLKCNCPKCMRKR